MRGSFFPSIKSARAILRITVVLAVAALMSAHLPTSALAKANCLEPCFAAQSSVALEIQSASDANDPMEQQSDQGECHKACKTAMKRPERSGDWTASSWAAYRELDVAQTPRSKPFTPPRIL